MYDDFNELEEKLIKATDDIFHNASVPNEVYENLCDALALVRRMKSQMEKF